MKRISLPVIQDHVVEVQLGGEIPDNLRRLGAAENRVGTWEPREGVPRTRGDCPADRFEKGCGFYRCRFFLWRNEDPPGRPGLSHVPRGKHGHTERVLGNLGPKSPPVLLPRWLEDPLPPSCALDVTDRGALTNDELGAVLNKHRTLAARLVKRAVASLIKREVTLDELLLIADPDAKPLTFVSRATPKRRFRCE